MSNLQTMRAIYEAFGRGDVPAILEHISEDVDWEYAYRAAPNPVPWLQPRRGRAGAAAFFESLGALEFHRFEATAFLEGDGVVVVLVDLEATVRQTGRRIVETDEAHIWHFGPDGKVVRMRHGADTHQQVQASQA